jgi:hypothetical protein
MGSNNSTEKSIHTHMPCINTWIHPYTHTHMHTHMDAFIHTHMHTYIDISIRRKHLYIICWF